jgi:EmrB/QacA subfamily drug resistance transporter
LPIRHWIASIPESGHQNEETIVHRDVDVAAPEPPDETADGGPAGRQHYGVTLAVLAVAAMSFALLQTMVAPALPDMQQALNVSTSSITWVLTIYLLTASIATPIFGRLGDIYGKEHMMLVVLVVFGLGCLMSALSHSFPLLVAGRAVQGAGGAVFPLAFGIIRDEFPAERVATGIGLISATFGIGGGAGLVLSGLIVDHLSYEWIFWLGLAAAAVAATATWLFVPESPIKTPARIDWIGAVFLSAGLSCLLLAISEGASWGWHSGRIVGLFAAAVAILALWIVLELRISEPLVDMNLMRLRGVWTTNLCGFLIGFSMFGSFILIPRFVQTPAMAGYGFSASVTAAGVFLLPTAVIMLVAGPAAGALGTRHGFRFPLLIGCLVASAAFVSLAAAHTHKWHIYVAGTGLGLGIGFAFASMANLIVDAVPPSHTGVATGMNTIMRTIGGAMGGQIAASIVAGHIEVSGLPAESGYTAAFVLSAAMAFVAFLAGLAVPRATPTQAR